MDVGGNNFGNFKNIFIYGMKFYDTNANGVKNTGVLGEQGIVGWPIKLSGSASSSTTTGAGGIYCFGDLNGDGFSDLGPGTYYVTEGAARIDETWNQTTVNPAAIVATSGLVSIGNDFGNVKLGQCGGLTKGFWGNKNGLALLTQTHFVGLTALNLRNVNGSVRDFTGTLLANRTALETWLQDTNATNMAYMLSAQLAATYLNTTVDLDTGTAGPQLAVDPSALIYVPGIYGWSSNSQGSALRENLYGTVGSPLSLGETWSTSGNYVALSEVMGNSNTILGTYGTIGSTVLTNSVFRKHAEALKIVLDAVNNSNSNNSSSPGSICVKKEDLLW